MIVKAAIMYSNGEIVEGYNYGKILIIANKLGLTGDRIEGFVTSAGDFILPQEATKLATEAGQITNITDFLTPEDLWPEPTL